MGDAHEHRGTVRTPPRSQGVQHTATQDISRRCAPPRCVTCSAALNSFTARLPRLLVGIGRYLDNCRCRHDVVLFGMTAACSSCGLRVLFLDVDGVISARTPGKIESTKLKRLVAVCESTHAAVVVSSHWRLVPVQLQLLVRTLRLQGLDVIGVTPSRRPWDPHRPLEITDWLRAYNAAADAHAQPRVLFFAAVDDRPLLDEVGGGELLGHCVTTDKDEGLTEAAAAELKLALCRPIARPALLGGAPPADSTTGVAGWAGGFVRLQRRPRGELPGAPHAYMAQWHRGDEREKPAPRCIVVSDSAVDPSAGRWAGRTVSSLLAGLRRGKEVPGEDERGISTHGGTLCAAVRRASANPASPPAPTRRASEEARTVHGGSAFLSWRHLLRGGAPASPGSPGRQRQAAPVRKPLARPVAMRATVSLDMLDGQCEISPPGE